MAEKYEQPAQGYPLAPAAVVPRSDQEYGGNYASQEQFKKKKRTKRLVCIAAFAVVQTIVIVAIALVVVRVRTPRIRLTDVTVTNALTGGGNVGLTARVRVRNMNFGRYEFDGGPAIVRSGDTEVGRFLIQDERVRARSTRRFYVAAPNLNLSLVTGNGSRVLDLNVRARLRGEVRLLRVIRRNRSADLNCTMTVDLSTNVVRNLRCQ